MWKNEQGAGMGLKANQQSSAEQLQDSSPWAYLGAMALIITVPCHPWGTVYIAWSMKATVECLDREENTWIRPWEEARTCRLDSDTECL